jgi:hypothetical protein
MKLARLLVVAAAALVMAGAATHTGASASAAAHVRIVSRQGISLGVSQPLGKLVRQSAAASINVGSVNVTGITASDPHDPDIPIALGTAAGPNNVLQTAGDTLKICNRSGSCGASVKILQQIFGDWAAAYCNGDGGWAPPQMGGSAVAYDSLADRFIVVIAQIDDAASNGPGMCVAVSTTSNPSGTYNRWFFPTTPQEEVNGFSSTHPAIGVWPDAYYLSDLGSLSVVAVQRSALLSGQCCAGEKEITSGLDMVPASFTGTTAPPSGAPGLFVQLFSDDPTADDLTFNGVNVFKFHVDWSNTNNSTLTNAGALRFGNPKKALCPDWPEDSCVVEPSAPDGFNLSGDFGNLRSANYRDNGGTQQLVFTNAVDLNSEPIASDPVRGAIAWHELRLSSSGAPSITQEGVFSPDAGDRWAGAAAFDSNGDIGITYSLSSPTVFPSVRATGRLSTDSLGTTTQGETSFVTSSSSITDWGDFIPRDWSPNALTVDPDGCTFWNSGLFVISNLWASRITSFQLPNCNLAKFKATSASSTVSPNATSRAVDGTNDITNYWESGGGSTQQWFKVDLGDSTKVKRILMNWDQTNYPTGYTIDSSNDGTNWSRVNFSTTGGITAQTANVSVTARYFRINLIARNQAAQTYRLHELQAFSS